MGYYAIDLKFIYQVNQHVYLSTYGKGLVYFAVQTRKAELIEQRLMEIERVKARAKLQEAEKHLSGILYERGIDSKGFAMIRSKGDQFQICHILQIINSLLFYDFAIHFI